ncbi:dTDP-4-dehydrorhamnose 3,5-epimerase [Sphingobium phenoxybenzoativorans]|nr:dTDP-4-dehydrorhamnose 3,5-epimerase [Sphingobium phenoxybenzoativorans]
MEATMESNSIPSPIKLITPRRFGDDRGWFSETYSEKGWAEKGVRCRFVQDNHSYSRPAGTVRGIHFQSPPHAQDKLVRCVRGRIMDYAVDLRKGSPTYGQHVAAELTADNGHQLFVPVGFGHAFVTLEPDVEVIYKVSDIYAPDCDGGVLWNCPTIGINWPLPEGGPTLSPKDMVLPALADFDSPFTYDGQPLLPL